MNQNDPRRVGGGGGVGGGGASDDPNDGSVSDSAVSFSLVEGHKKRRGQSSGQKALGHKSSSTSQIMAIGQRKDVN